MPFSFWFSYLWRRRWRTSSHSRRSLASWGGMLEHGRKEGIWDLLRNWRTALALIATFGLTLVENLTVGIIAGCLLAAAFAIFDRAIPREVD
jgi:hypothetical protein